MITAHSGCEGTRDNSPAFLAHALTLAVDALEVDVRRDAAGELRLHHDGDIPPDAPRLADALTLLRGHPAMRINCDLKEPGLEAAVYALAAEYGLEDRLIYTGTVDPTLFRRGAVRFPRAAWYANADTFLPAFFALQQAGMDADTERRLLLEVLEEMPAYDVRGINWYFGMAEGVWEKAREMGIGISVWTVNEETDMRTWLARGAENITTRRPVRLLELRKDLHFFVR